MKLPRHPLRKTLTPEDWDRIQHAIDNDLPNEISDEEVEAAHDLLYDAIANKTQTHMGVITLQ